MLERCVGTLRVRQIQRAIRHAKVTFLCLFLTVVVLRGTVGAGKFGTPEQDFNDLREHFYVHRKRVEPHRVLEEVQTTTNATNGDNSNGDSNGNTNGELLFGEAEGGNADGVVTTDAMRLAETRRGGARPGG